MNGIAAVGEETSSCNTSSRTHACIALLSTGTQGAIKFLSLATGKIVTRSQFKVLPTPDTVAAHMDALAKRESSDPVHSLDFSMAGAYVSSSHDGTGVIYDDTPAVSIDAPVVLDADEAGAERDHVLVEQRADDSFTDSTSQGPTQSIIIGDEPLKDTQSELPESNLPLSSPETPGVQEIAPANHRYPLRSRTSPMSNLEYEELRSRPHPTRRTKEHSESNVYAITVTQALKDPNRSLPAIEAIDLELQQMIQMNVFRPIHRHEEVHLKKPIRSHMFLKEKYDADGTFDKLKARLVGGGNMQPREEVLHEDVSSPTAAMPFMLCVASIAAKEKRHVVTADVPSAYLHADNSKHGITMILDSLMTKRLTTLKPDWSPFTRPDGTTVVVLGKAIYGCIESARLWYNLLTSILETQGYMTNALEPCIMNKTVNGVQGTVIIYVDDLMFTSTDKHMIDTTITHLESQLHCKLKVKTGPIHSYLGLQRTRKM